MNRKRVYLLLFVCVLLLILLSFYWFFNGSPWNHQAASNHAKDFTSDKYEVELGKLIVKGSLYNFGRGHFAIQLVNNDTNEEFFIEVKLKQNREVHSIFDATGMINK